MSLEAVYGGPAVHKLERANPTEIILRLIKKNPRATREKIEQLFIDEVRDEEEYLVPCLKYYFWNAWNGLQPRSPPKPLSEDRVDCAANKLRLVIISKLIMPNGKRIADCTGSEMAKFGRFGLAVSKVVGRAKVGKKMTEKELARLYLQTR